MPSLFPVSPFTAPIHGFFIRQLCCGSRRSRSLGFSFVWCTECVMNQCYQPRCHNFLSSKYSVCPKTVALKKSKWLVKHFLSWLSFLVQLSVPDSRSEFKPIARSWWFIKSGVRCVCAKRELGESHYCPWWAGGGPRVRRRARCQQRKGASSSQWHQMSSCPVGRFGDPSYSSRTSPWAFYGFPSALRLSVPLCDLGSGVSPGRSAGRAHNQSHRLWAHDTSKRSLARAQPFRYCHLVISFHRAGERPGFLVLPCTLRLSYSRGWGRGWGWFSSEAR